MRAKNFLILVACLAVAFGAVGKKEVLMFLSLIFIIAQAGIANASENAKAWLAPDFFVETTKISSQPILLGADVKDCRQQIKSAMCLVDSADEEGSEPDGPRPCLDGGDAYAKYFEAIYDQYPPALQKVFCSVKVIYIEKNVLSSSSQSTRLVV